MWCWGALPSLSIALHGTFSSTAVSAAAGLCLSWRECLLPCTGGSFIFYHGPSACQEEFSIERQECGKERDIGEKKEGEREGESKRERMKIRKIEDKYREGKRQVEIKDLRKE